MTKRIVTESLAAKPVTEISKDVKGHIRTLRALAKVAHGVMQTMLAFELQIKLSIDELENQPQLGGNTHPNTSKELLTLREAARKLGVSVTILRKNTEGRLPKPITTAERGVMYRRADVDQWLLRGA